MLYEEIIGYGSIRRYPAIKTVFHKLKKKSKMIQVIKKSDQYEEVIFNDRFYGNKPVTNEMNNVKPYSNLYYWNHGKIVDNIEFSLHPHKGFEIMTFVLKGQQEHFDTSTKSWILLKAGDFQIMQSNNGIQHAEKISSGTSAFQIWFDPNFQKSLLLKATYKDYRSEDFLPKIENGINTITYVGLKSKAIVLTPQVVVKKLIFNKQTRTTIILNEDCSYTFYILRGTGLINNQEIEQDDAVRISIAKSLDINLQGELFYIQSPTKLNYKTVWN